MSSFAIDTPSSLAWKEICELTQRSSDVLLSEWGVDNRALSGPSPGSPDERHLFAQGRMLMLTREKNGYEITAYVKDLARVRRFKITMSASGQPQLNERRGEPRSVREMLDELVAWLKKGDAVV